MEFEMQFKPLIKNPYWQTALGSLIDFEKELSSITHFISVEDDDLIAVEISTPKDWREENGTIFLVHGLCGSHKSPYMKRIARRLYKKGIKVGRINLRGCGSGKGLAKGIYHAGSSGDILSVLKHFSDNSPTLLIGFSLGGNICLKLAGELKEEGHDFFKGIIAVCPPADLLATSDLFSSSKNQILSKRLVRELLNDIKFRQSHFAINLNNNFPSPTTLRDIDELYVAPQANFSGALEYYYYCSANRYVRDISLPTKILLANDDPFISASSFDDIILPKQIALFKSSYGGHLGFLGFNVFKEFRYLDNLVITWVEEML